MSLGSILVHVFYLLLLKYYTCHLHYTDNHIKINLGAIILGSKLQIKNYDNFSYGCCTAKGQKTRDNEEQILDNLILLPAVSIINNFLLFRFFKQIIHVVYIISAILENDENLI